MVIGGGLDHCIMPPSIVGGCTVASELQAENTRTVASNNATRNSFLPVLFFL